MADAKPILILQMQRMGDLVMTFPLLGRLKSLFPENPVWVAAEEVFFKGLMPLAPDAVFFPYSAAAHLKKREYAMVINLSHRPEAAALAGELRTEERLGQYRVPSRASGGKTGLAAGGTAGGTSGGGATYIAGDWQLYRHSLVRNNRYNLYHWADLNGLELSTTRTLLRTIWALPDSVKNPGNAKRVGLFLGASEADKRPEAPFWAELAQKLLARGHKPVFLGGEAEKESGAALGQQLRSPALNLCGRFSVHDLARFIAELDLLITPDTGPMHIAAWVGTRVLNLSTGPVNPWETGPFTPGHYVLRPTLACAGCWQCRHAAPFCKNTLHPGRVAFIANSLLNGNEAGLGELRLPGQELLLTGRDKHGLFELAPLPCPQTPKTQDASQIGAGQIGAGQADHKQAGPEQADAGQARNQAAYPDACPAPRPAAHRARLAFGHFWQAFFGVNLKLLPADALVKRRNELLNLQPAAAPRLLKQGEMLALKLVRAKKNAAFPELAAELAAEPAAGSATDRSRPDLTNGANGAGRGSEASLAGQDGPLSPLRNYLGLYLQNNECSLPAQTRALELAEAFMEQFRG